MALKEPAGQNWSQKMLPVAAVQEPGGHSRHVARPGTGLYEPASHGKGAAEPEGQEAPVGHCSVQEVAPAAAEKVPPGQGAQAGEPAAEEYLPGGHAAGAPAPPGHALPAGHAAAVADVDPAAHQKPGAHTPEQPGEASCVVLPKKPPAQSLGTAEPWGQ